MKFQKERFYKAAIDYAKEKKYTEIFELLSERLKALNND